MVRGILASRLILSWASLGFHLKRTLPSREKEISMWHEQRLIWMATDFPWFQIALSPSCDSARHIHKNLTRCYSLLCSWNSPVPILRSFLRPTAIMLRRQLGRKTLSFCPVTTPTTLIYKIQWQMCFSGSDWYYLT